jgi:saccharopine dehydrogenase-like NADP-dependent oxidoreductase
VKILVLGLGMQGKTAVYDLYHNQDVKEIIVADLDISIIHNYIQEHSFQDKVFAEFVDAEKTETLHELFAHQPNIVIDLLPAKYVDTIAEEVINNGINLINTNYITEKIKSLSSTAIDRNITILPEFGLDPGVDLILLGKAIEEFDEITKINSYGAGLPDIEAANNILKYKITWSLEGVLKSYTRQSRIIHNGKTIDIPGDQLFSEENLHFVNIENIGQLEAFPNGDAVKYIELLNLDKSKIQSSGRYTLRYPGHSKIWKNLVDLQLLRDDPIEVNGHKIDPRKYLENLLAPQLTLQDHERDLVIVRVDVQGKKNGRNITKTLEIIDRKDLETGFTGMSRTVGFTVSIGAHLLSSKAINKSGVVSPVFDIPYDLFFDELKKRNITVRETEIEE